jgi:hypothetical protein
MSDQTIRAGDLVMVVRSPSHVCTERFIGHVYRVSAVGTHEWECRLCGYEATELFACERSGDPEEGFPAAWVQKINPPAISSHTENKEELTA